MQTKLYPLGLLFIALTLFCTPGAAQPGSPNFSFGTGGLVKQRFYSNSNLFPEMATGTVKLPDGRSVVAVTANNKTLLVRLTPAGTVDSTYGTGGYSQPVSLVNSTMAPGPEGRIYVAGYFGIGFGLACYDDKGALVKGFGEEGLAVTYFNTTAYVQSVQVQPDGKIVLAGHTNIGPNYNLALARFHADGSPDPSFGNGGKLTTDFGFGDYGYASALQADGKIVVAGGSSTSATGGNIMSAVRYHSDGRLDSSFGKGGRALLMPAASQSAFAVKTLKDGTILLGGGNLDFVLAHLDSKGQPDSTFGKAGVVATHFESNSEVIRSLEVQEDNRIVVAGDVRDRFNKPVMGLARYLPGGVPDSSFGAGGKTTVSLGTSIATLVRQVTLWPEGKIAVAGSVQDPGSSRDYALFVFNEVGKTDTTFGKYGVASGYVDGEITEYRAMAVQGDRKIIAGGYTNGTGNPNFALARYTETGVLDPSFGKGGLVMNDFGNGDMLNAVQLLPDGRILAGGIISTPTGNDFLLARYWANGSLDSTFGQGGRTISIITPNSDNLTALAVQADGRILAGGGTTTPSGPGIPPTQQYLLARYHPDGALDSTFGLDGKLTGTFGYSRGGLLIDVKVLPGGKILTLNRGINIDNSGDIILARYHADGVLDSSFGKIGLSVVNSGPIDAGQSLELQKDGKILVGGYLYQTGADMRFALVRFDADGRMDSTFGEGGKIFTSFTGRDQGQTVSIQRDGKIILAGQSNHTNDLWDLSIARYNADGSPDSTFGVQGKVVHDLGGEDYFTRSAIIGNNLYVAGTNRGLTAYGAVASYVLKEKLQINCPKDVVVPADRGSCSAVVSGIDPVLVSAWGDEPVTFALSGATIGAGTGSASGQTFQKGVTKVMYTVKEDFAKNCIFYVTVTDTEPPVIAHQDTSFAFCAKPGGAYTIPRLRADDSCGLVTFAYTVYSATGQVIRSGKGDDASGSFGIGKHIISWTVTDGSGNVSTAFFGVTIHANPTVTIPDAYALNRGVLANTVYIGYAPASSLTLQAGASGGSAPYGYSWSNGDKAAASTVSPTAPTAYTVLVTDGNGCQDSTTKYVEVQDIRAGNNGAKVALCHTLSTEPVTFTIEPVDVTDHLEHGDMLGRCAGSTRYVTTHTAVPEQYGVLSVQALPNPATEYFSIRISGAGEQPLHLRVTDLLGRIVEQKQNLAANHMYRIGAAYRPGIYFIEVVQGTERKVVKLVKQDK